MHWFSFGSCFLPVLSSTSTPVACRKAFRNTPFGGLLVLITDTLISPFPQLFLVFTQIVDWGSPAPRQASDLGSVLIFELDFFPTFFDF